MITNTGSATLVRVSAPALVCLACSPVNSKSDSSSVSLDWILVSRLSFFFIMSVSFRLKFVVFESASSRSPVKAQSDGQNYHRKKHFARSALRCCDLAQLPPSRVVRFDRVRVREFAAVGDGAGLSGLSGQLGRGRLSSDVATAGS